MKKSRLLLTVVVISLTACLIGVLVYSLCNTLYAPQASPQANSSAEIIDFAGDMSWSIPGGMQMNVWFNLTVKNAGSTDINGAYLSISRIGNESDSEIGFYYYYSGTIDTNGMLGVLHSGETRLVIAI